MLTEEKSLHDMQTCMFVLPGMTLASTTVYVFKTKACVVLETAIIGPVKSMAK